MSEKTLYGWEMQSIKEGAQGLDCLYAPANESSEVIAALWYMPWQGDEVMLSLPAGCVQGIIGKNRIVAVAREGYYSMSFSGTGMTLHPLQFHIDEVMAVLPGNSFIARSGHALYLVPLP